MVTEGMVKRGAKVRLLRDNVVIHEGTLKTLEAHKDEVREVQHGFECGMAFERLRRHQGRRRDRMLRRRGSPGDPLGRGAPLQWARHVDVSNMKIAPLEWRAPSEG